MDSTRKKLLIVSLFALLTLGFFLVRLLTYKPTINTSKDYPRYDQKNPPEITAEEAYKIAKSVDFDKDGLSNADDNCPAIYNPSQKDSDKDGFGDDCEGKEYLIEKVKSDLADFKKIPIDEIQIKKIEEVVWSNACYDISFENRPCSKNVKTPGYRILLTYENYDYEYRTDKNQDFILLQYKN